MAPPLTIPSVPEPSPSSATSGGASLLAQSACGHVAAPEPAKPTGPAGSASESETTGRGGKPESVSSLRSRLLRTSPWGPSAAARLEGRALLSAHLDAGNPRGPDALSGERTFNDCGGVLREHGPRCAGHVPGVATRKLPQRPERAGPQSPSLGSGSLSARPAAVPGSSLPEFRALLFIAAFPVAVVAFVAAVIFIFLPSEPEKNFGSDGVSVSIRTAREHTE